jgi:hypothetical protein
MMSHFTKFKDQDDEISPIGAILSFFSNEPGIQSINQFG